MQLVFNLFHIRNLSIDINGFGDINLPSLDSVNKICHNWIRRLQYQLAIIGFGDYSLTSLDSVNTIFHNWIRRLQFPINGFGDYILPSLDSAISTCHNWIRRLQFAIIGSMITICHHWKFGDFKFTIIGFVDFKFL